MPKKGITYEDTAAAADALVAEGASPTLDNVRKRLGTGSKGTIQKHMSTWRDKCPQVAAVATEVPVDIANRIAEEINRAKHEGRAEIGEKLVISQAEATELATTCVTLEAELDRLMEEFDSVSKFRDRLLVQLQEQAAEVEHLTRENERERSCAEQARIEVARVYNRIEILSEKIAEQSASIERLNMEFSAATNAKISSEKEAAVLASRLAAELETIKRALLEKEELAGQLQEARQSAETCRIDAVKIYTAHQAQGIALAESDSKIKKLEESLASEQIARIEAARVANAYETQRITLAECISAKQELTGLYDEERDARIAVEKQAAVLAARLEELIRISRHNHQHLTPDSSPGKELFYNLVDEPAETHHEAQFGVAS